MILGTSVYTVSAQPPPPQSSNIFDLSFGGKIYNIAYSLTSGEVTDISIDEPLTVTVRLQNADNGFLQISFPREFMTSFFKVGDESGNYHAAEVFVDSIPVGPEIIADCEAANYRIPIETGAETIEFAGTYLPANLPPSPPPERYTFFYTITIAPREFRNIRVATNADECEISLIASEKKLQVNIEGATGEHGYLAVVVPHNILGGNYTVLVDGAAVEFNATFAPRGSYLPQIREDSTVISLSYEGSDKPTEIEIIGTSVIPEFGETLILSISIVAGIIAALLSGRYACISQLPPRTG